MTSSLAVPLHAQHDLLCSPLCPLGHVIQRGVHRVELLIHVQPLFEHLHSLQDLGSVWVVRGAGQVLLEVANAELTQLGFVQVDVQAQQPLTHQRKVLVPEAGEAVHAGHLAWALVSPQGTKVQLCANGEHTEQHKTNVGAMCLIDLESLSVISRIQLMGGHSNSPNFAFS